MSRLEWAEEVPGLRVERLIALLSKMPGKAEVGLVYDGADRMDVKVVVLAQSGRVLLNGGDPHYYDDDRPVGAPTEEEDPYWVPEPSPHTDSEPQSDSQDSNKPT